MFHRSITISLEEYNEIGEYTKSLAELKDKVSKINLSCDYRTDKRNIKKLFDSIDRILGQYGTDLKNL